MRQNHLSVNPSGKEGAQVEIVLIQLFVLVTVFFVFLPLTMVSFSSPISLTPFIFFVLQYPTGISNENRFYIFFPLWLPA